MLGVVQGEDKNNIDLGPLTEVIKRDGEKHAFDASKIAMAITRAGEATNEFGSDEAWLLTRQVIKVLKHKFAFGMIPAIEQIQDVVEQVLISSNYYKTARSYIVYREQRDKMRKDKHAAIDAISSINEYLDRSDWRVNANANQGYSLGGLILNVAGKVVANYWLNHVYTPEIGEAHRNGDYHIHDLDMLSGYCAGWSLRVLLTEGFNGVPNKVESKPPRHLVSAFSQMINFLGTLQNEWAGAQAFSSADTYLAPFVRIEKLTYEEVKQAMQSFIFNLNVPSRWGTQTPFTNLTFDWTCPLDLKDRHPIIGDVRAIGCLQAIEIVKDRTTKEPFAEAGQMIYQKAFEKGLAWVPSGHILRMSPPMILDDEVALKGLDIIEEAVAETEKHFGY